MRISNERVVSRSVERGRTSPYRKMAKDHRSQGPPLGSQKDENSMGKLQRQGKKSLAKS